MREDPKGATSPGHAALLKGGFVRSVSQGLYSLLPLGLRVMSRLTTLIRNEMERLGGQEVLLPLVNPSEIWEQSGRDAIFGDEIIRFRDRGGKRVLLAPTHEEAMVELVRSVLSSYRQLPIFLFQFQEKYRNERRTRAGLIRTREFVMKDGYSFHRSSAELNNFFPQVFQAYKRIFDSCNVPTITAEAAVGMMLGERSYEFLMPCSVGDDWVTRCPSCGYAANKDVAVGTLEAAPESPREVHSQCTHDARRIRDMAEQLELPSSRLAKTMVYCDGDRTILAVVRGDQEVSPEKLAHLTGASRVRLAEADHLEKLGLDPAYISPIDLRRGDDSPITIVVDTVVTATPNLAMAANDPHHHAVDVNFGRDFEGEIVGDIARVLPGAKCIHCGTVLDEERVVELGNIFKLGDYYTRRMKLSLIDAAGRRIYPSMGAYGIGMGRLLAAVAEANTDKRGIAWPSHLAPYCFFLMGIGRSRSVARIADSIHEEFPRHVLFDDRKLSISAKFRDADLIGIPYRIIVSPRTLEQGHLEILERGTPGARRVQLENLGSVVAELSEGRG
jgi:prolyl-tRNA synthetase